MTRPDLDALQALLDKATPGPWTAGEPILGIPRFIVADCGPTGKVYPATNEVSHGTTSMDDAALIAAAVNALPGMISYVRELERRVNEGSVIHDRTIALAMRERCAEECSAVARQHDRLAAPGHAAVADECAAAILALEL